MKKVIIGLNYCTENSTYGKEIAFALKDCYSKKEIGIVNPFDLINIKDNNALKELLQISDGLVIYRTPLNDHTVCNHVSQILDIASKLEGYPIEYRFFN